MLLLADRGFPAYGLCTDTAATGAQLLWRVSQSFTLPLVQVLPDGTCLSELRGRRKGERMPVRVVEYTVTTATLGPDGTTEETSELFCLITTLLDPVTAPAQELAELYTSRWTSETIFKHIKIEQRGGRTATLRSNSPAMVEQELWAMLCVYQAVHELALDAAAQAQIPVAEISFKNTLAAVRRTVGTAFPPRQLTAKARDVRTDLIRQAVTPRPGRAAPRAAKRSGTGYRTLKPDEPATTRVAHTVKLQLFPQERRPGSPATLVALAPRTNLDEESRTFEHFTAAA